MALCLCQTALYLTALLAAFVPPALFWWPAAVTLGFPFLLAGQVVAVLLLVRMASGKRAAWAFWLLLVPGMLRMGAYAGWHGQRSGPLRVLSMNANYFGALDSGLVHDKIVQAQDRLRGLQPDVLCGQDYTTDSEPNNDFIHQFVRAELGVKHRVYCTPSLWTYSRQPISEYRGAFFPDSDNSFCYVDTTLDNKPVRVFNLHLQSYQFGAAIAGPRRSLPARAARRLRNGLQMRSQQVDIVAAFIRSSPHPVIVCGDFNDVPSSYAYSRLSSGLQDGFSAAGKGVAVTYRGPLPGLRIDYILCSPELVFTNYQHLDGPDYMDHRWVYAELRWR